jgi:hypothetical protein
MRIANGMSTHGAVPKVGHPPAIRRCVVAAISLKTAM